MDHELSTQLRKVIETGEKVSSGTYKLVDGYKLYESWRNDCNLFFEYVQDVFNSAVQSPADIKSGIKFLDELLKGEEPEEDSE